MKHHRQLTPPYPPIQKWGMTGGKRGTTPSKPSLIQRIGRTHACDVCPTSGKRWNRVSWSPHDPHTYPLPGAVNPLGACVPNVCAIVTLTVLSVFG